MEVIVRNEAGKSKQVLKAEVEHIEFDKRRKSKLVYVTLASISRAPRLDLTYNIVTGNLSLVGRHGFHTFFAVLDNETLIKLVASLSINNIRD